MRWWASWNHGAPYEVEEKGSWEREELCFWPPGPGGMKVRGKTLLICLIYLSIHKGRSWRKMVAHLQSQHLEMGIRRTVCPKLPWEYIANSRPPLRLCLQTKQSKNIMSKVKQWETQIAWSPDSTSFPTYYEYCPVYSPHMYTCMVLYESCRCVARACI